MKDRLAEFMRRERLTAVKFAEIMEVQPSSISHLLSGRNKPNFEFISRILLRFPELNPDWIINGQGGVYKSKTTEPSGEVTNEKSDRVTDVIPPIRQESSTISGEEQVLDLFNNNAESIVDSEDTAGVTSVNAKEETMEEPKAESEDRELPKKEPSKNIARVILFFEDGSFEEYHN